MKAEILQQPDFWRFYFNLESDDWDEDEVDAHIDEIATQLAVVDEVISYEHAGDTHQYTTRCVALRLETAPGLALVIEYSPAESVKYLLVERDGVRTTLGWWDPVRSHPYCLRADELRDFAAAAAGWSPAIVTLLLFQFVGVADAAENRILKQRVIEAIEEVGLTIDLEDVFKLGGLMTAEEYRWVKLGTRWHFTSDEYSCYSLRNESHGEFPWESFDALLARTRAASR